MTNKFTTSRQTLLTFLCFLPVFLLCHVRMGRVKLIFHSNLTYSSTECFPSCLFSGIWEMYSLALPMLQRATIFSFSHLFPLPSVADGSLPQYH